MKYAILSDLHANRQALEAVLAHAQARQAQRWAVLGDLVGYGGDPAWVVDCVREMQQDGAIVLQGNHDEATVRGSSAQMRPQVAALIQWTQSQLSAEQLTWLQQLPFTADEGELLFTHANAYAPKAWEYVAGRAEATKSMLSTARRITFCGHMHDPRIYNLSPIGKTGEFTPTAGAAVPLMRQRHWLVIPGSVGQPRDGNPAACYALYDDDRGELTVYRVPYDVPGAAARILEVGLPLELAKRLEHGV